MRRRRSKLNSGNPGIGTAAQILNIFVAAAVVLSFEAEALQVCSCGDASTWKPRRNQRRRGERCIAGGPPMRSSATHSNSSPLRPRWHHLPWSSALRVSDGDDRDGGGSSPPIPSSTSVPVYNDDCFGLTSFVAGFGTGDVAFVSVFVGLTATAAVLTRLGLLPPDGKNPSIVNRKVPGVIAALTLLLSPTATSFMEEGGMFDSSDVAPWGRSVQITIGVFSMVTAFLDIRWRDNL